MPELPEVQTVLSTLENQIKGLKIVDINILYKSIIEDDINHFKNALIGKTFKEFKRRGKYLLFVMDDCILVSHLRMEGKYFIKKHDEEINKHTHVIFKLNNGYDLRYNDVRKFGRMEIIDKDYDLNNFHGLGPEPFDDNINLDYVKNKFKNNVMPIKSVLLDQSFVAGIGNIYADEILFKASINPLEKPNRINDDEIKALIKETRSILKKAIKAGGTTIRSYTSSLGVTGRFQLNLNVHTKDICPICNNQIKKIRVGGRGTYYCENCQKLKRRIAITGTIGSGKSTLSDIIRDNGYYVFDCDAYNKELLKKGTDSYLRIKELFPNAFVNNELDKSLLSKIILSDPKQKKKLESILHPLIIEKMLNEANKHKLYFAEVPLLFEKNLDKYFDKTLLIVSNKKNTLERLKIRGLSNKDANSFINNQMSIEDKIQRSDEIIYNDSSLSSLKKKANEWLNNVR